MTGAGEQIVWTDATDQAAAIRAGEVSALELVDNYLARIERFDPELGAYVHVAAESARAAAAAADAVVRAAKEPDQLPTFHGVTLSVKDNVDVARMPTTHACKLLLDNVAEADDPVIHRFRNGGFVILGKSNLPEFCTSMTDSDVFGPCRNPWDRALTAGGSSGGAAAALAAGLCALGHGTDGAGSVRVPAAFCGLVGVKPTRGLLAANPQDQTAFPGTSEHGFVCRSIRDAAALLDVLTNGAWSPGATVDYREERHGPLDRLRIAVTTTPPMGATDPEVVAVVDRTAALLESLGHHTFEATPDWWAMLAAFGPTNVPGAASLIDAEQMDLVEPRNRALVRSLRERTVLQHARWFDELRTATRRFNAFWDDVDVLLSPTCGVVAPSVEFAPWHQSTEQHATTFGSFPNFAQPFNLSGQPALSLPIGSNGDGLPIGVHLAGRHLSEPVLLRLAAELEAAAPWAGTFPAGY